MTGYEFILTLAAMGLCSGLIFSVVRTVGRYLEHKHSGAGRELGNLRAELEALRAEVSDHQDGRAQRLLELEERMDFAERMLSQRQPQARLPEGN